MLPYAVTGAALTVFYSGVALAVRLYLNSRPVPDHPFPSWRPPWGYLTDFLAPQLVDGAVLLLGAAGFAAARRWSR